MLICRIAIVGAALMHQEVDSLIEVLKDGKWHSRKELSQKTSICEPRVQKIIDFLANFSFIELCISNKQRIRARLMLINFLKKLS